MTLASFCERFVEGELKMFHVKPLRLKQRMVGEREPMNCPLAPDVPDAERGSLALGDAEPLVPDQDLSRVVLRSPTGSQRGRRVLRR